MKAEEWERIKALFDAALNVPREERGRWLAEVCSGRPDLRDTLDQLLQSYDESSVADPRALEPDPVFLPGQIVAQRFRVLRLIARGGMGEVYEAQDASLNGLRVALKTIRTEIAEEKHAYERFKREVWVAREVAHEGICRIFDLVEHHDSNKNGEDRIIPCLTMQLLDGRTLASALSTRRPMPPQECLPLISQIAQSLQIMHEKGIVHRDVKPSNIMLVDREDGGSARAVVMDFGLAKPLDKRSLLWETRTEQRVGAPYFIAPEVLRGEKGGVAVDLYALGLVIDEMVTRSPAFPNESIDELLWKKLHDDPIPPSARSEALPDSWEKTILWCLDRDPERRPRNTEEVLAGLNGKTPALPPPATVPKLVADQKPLALVQQPAPQPVEASPPRARFSRRWWLATGLALFLLPSLSAVFDFAADPIHTSIAVFPFENQTDDADYDYLCSGTTDEVMRRLVYIDGLQVYPVREHRIAGAAQTGSARFSLEGALRRQSGEVRLNITLIDNQSGSLVWAEGFESELKDPLLLESSITESMVRALSRQAQVEGGWTLAAAARRWLGTEMPLLPTQATASSTAFTEYLRGRELYQKKTLIDAPGAIAHFERAVSLDPKFALAYSALSDVQHTLLAYNQGDTQRLMATAYQYAERAVALNPSLPDGYVSLGAARQALWDWQGAEQGYKAAIELQPRFARAHHWYAGLLLQFGRFEESLALAAKGIELDPFDYPSQSNYGLYLWHAGRPREAAAHLEDLLTKNDLLFAHIVLGQVYAALAVSSPEPESTDFFARSLREAGIVRARELDAVGGTDRAGFLKWSDLVFAQAHAARGDQAAAQLYINRLEHGLEEGMLSASAVAWAYAAVGNEQRTLELLEMGAARHEREMLYVRVTPLLRSLHSDQRFTAVLRQMALL
jgi:serine/threonine protein kinase/tetratricopeptide (TPR) repeat protein